MNDMAEGILKAMELREENERLEAVVKRQGETIVAQSCEGRAAFEAGYRSAYDSFAITDGDTAEAEEHYQAMLEYDLKDYLGTVSEGHDQT